jgi:ergothioneine biosynthesis protein EgtB
MPQTQQLTQSRNSLRDQLFETRRHSLSLAAPLSPEDQVVQAHEDASPTKWHLAHVTWFFETFVLQRHLPGYRTFDDRFGYCFNSYYESEGARHPRPQRGLLTRPTHDEVRAYRAHVDAALDRMFAAGIGDEAESARLVEIGIHHEQQHQELLMTDILALFAKSPIRPAYREHAGMIAAHKTQPLRFMEHSGGIRQIGNRDGFGWDNEYPRHDALLHPFALADRLVTNGEWLEFIEDGGYRQPLLWLSDGWARVQAEQWTAPLYWENHDGHWRAMTLEGFLPLDPAGPVCHVSYYEADAFARWAQARLPTEFEWESVAENAGDPPAATGALRPQPAHSDSPMSHQMFGEVWQWTQSAYLPYPRYRPPPGALGEYNGKFMCSQQALRGSSCVTPSGHSRSSYRNFFYPWQRWQFMGLRLARDVA